MTDTVVELRRYPVKSMQGLVADELTLTDVGVAGDRTWGLLDNETGRLASAKRFAALLTAAGTDSDVTLPDGSVVALDDHDADRRLSDWLGRDVHVVHATESADLSYQMTFDPPNDDADLFDIPVTAGTLVDLAAVHLINKGTLEHCHQQRPDLDWDIRRFRPNIVIDVETEPFGENAWAGSTIEIGDAALNVQMPTVRCAMPLRAQPGGLERQPAMFAAMNQLNPKLPNHVGLYLSVARPGTIHTGDAVTVVR